ncbi:hypothetical protein C8J57DRAFT_1617854 [Mycena rebaudengoi]|nr:hypothetical protein C8J57DRAFT_1617854 [Mycena rebaudengoi]
MRDDLSLTAVSHSELALVSFLFHHLPLPACFILRSLSRASFGVARRAWVTAPSVVAAARDPCVWRYGCVSAPLWRCASALHRSPSPISSPFSVRSHPIPSHPIRPLLPRSLLLPWFLAHPTPFIQSPSSPTPPRSFLNSFRSFRSSAACSQAPLFAFPRRRAGVSCEQRGAAARVLAFELLRFGACGCVQAFLVRGTGGLSEARTSSPAVAAPASGLCTGAFASSFIACASFPPVPAPHLHTYQACSVPARARSRHGAVLVNTVRLWLY